MHYPGEIHLKATYRILQYLREYNTDVDYAGQLLIGDPVWDIVPFLEETYILEK